MFVLDCPTGSKFENSLCACPTNYFEDTTSNECLKCTSSSSDVRLIFLNSLFRIYFTLVIITYTYVTNIPTLILKKNNYNVITLHHINRLHAPNHRKRVIMELKRMFIFSFFRIVHVGIFLLLSFIVYSFVLLNRLSIGDWLGCWCTRSCCTLFSAIWLQEIQRKDGRYRFETKATIHACRLQRS